MPKLILASSSPRRQAMIHDLSVPFIVDKPEIDESILKGEKPLVYVCRVAREKALMVSKRHSNKVILAADTTVSVGRTILGKPQTMDEARRMLEQMSGRRQQVLTAVCVISSTGKIYEIYTKTMVKFKPLSKGEIDKHVADVENWQGKAGAYGIQTTAGGVMIHSINGSYTGVIGLPLPQTINLLRRCGLDL